MNTAIILPLLQVASALLLSVQGNAKIPTAITQQAIALASQAVQQSVQLEVMPQFSFPIPKNNSIWPNITDLYNTAYISPDGGYVPNGTGVALDGENTSFGDLNGDGLDDAAAIVVRTNKAGQSTFSLAAMLNQNGIMFNIGDVDLGSTVQIFSHHVVQGGNIVLDMQIGNQPRATYTYEVLGDQIIKL